MKFERQTKHITDLNLNILQSKNASLSIVNQL